MGKEQKLRELLKYLKRLKNPVLCYSGGVDSTFLLWACSQVYACEEYDAVIFLSPTMPYGQMQNALSFASQLQKPPMIIKLDETQSKNFAKNDAERCYYCKKQRLELLSGGIFQGRLILDGANMDDLLDDRPGFKAAKEAKVISPFLDVNMFRNEIEEIARENNHPWGFLPPESCLITRIHKHKAINYSVLTCIDKGEQLIKSMGFSLVRLRWNQGRIRLEVYEKELPLVENRYEEIDRVLKAIGFARGLCGYGKYK